MTQALKLRLDHIALDQAPLASPLWLSTYGDEVYVPLAIDDLFTHVCCAC